MPVEAKLRKGKGAVGFYGSERTERSLQDFPLQADSDEEEEKKFKDQLQQWKKGEVRYLIALHIPGCILLAYSRSFLNLIRHGSI